MPKFTLKSIIKFLNSIIDILIPIIAVSLLLGVVFGPDAPFVGSIYLNINQVISMTVSYTHLTLPTSAIV